MWWMLAKGGPPPPMWVVVGVIAGIAGFVILGIAFYRHCLRERREELVKFFGDLGAWYVDLSAKGVPDAERIASFEPFRALGDVLKTCEKGIRWVAKTSVDSFEAHLIEHTYTTGSGKNQSVHHHTIIAIACPKSWATVSLTPEHLFTKIGKVFGLKDLDLENEAFNTKWRVKTEDENFALVLLGTQVQSYLAGIDNTITDRWFVQGGLIGLSSSRVLRPKDLAKNLGMVEGLLRALEPEIREQLERFPLE